MIHSVAGMLDGGRLVMRPPFREPHHSASQAALTGGGQRAKPGEVVAGAPRRAVPGRAAGVSRSRRWRRCASRWRPAAPRSRARRRTSPIPARFQLIAAMNPCRCGYLGDAARECGRAPRCGEDYQNRISGPLLDRIDLTVEVQPASAAELARAPKGEPSASVALRVARARAAQRSAVRRGRRGQQRRGRQRRSRAGLGSTDARGTGDGKAAAFPSRLHAGRPRGPNDSRPSWGRGGTPDRCRGGACVPTPNARAARIAASISGAEGVRDPSDGTRRVNHEHIETHAFAPPVRVCSHKNSRQPKATGYADVPIVTPPLLPESVAPSPR